MIDMYETRCKVIEKNRTTKKINRKKYREIAKSCEIMKKTTNTVNKIGVVPSNL